MNIIERDTIAIETYAAYAAESVRWRTQQSVRWRSQCHFAVDSLYENR